MIQIAAVMLGLLAQLFPLPKLPLPIPVPGLPQSVPIPPVLREPPPITTTAADAQKQVPQLDDFNPRITRSLSWLRRNADGSIVLVPGAYAWTVQSYCLNVSAHAPGTDAAYLAAPLRGARASVVAAIVERAALHPEIAQQSIQLLLWAITSRARVADTGSAVRAAADVLMTAAERRDVDGGALGAIPSAVRDAVLNNAPQPVRDAYYSAQQVRDLLTNGNASYQEIERIAARPAKANNGAVPRARWTYAGGYFMRLQSQSYQHMRVEVYVPEGWTIARDAGGRITSIAIHGGRRLDLAYAGARARVTLTQPLPTVDRFAATHATATLPISWSAKDDTTALRALEVAIRSTPQAQGSWNASMRDSAADAAARARADRTFRALARADEAAPRIVAADGLGFVADGGALVSAGTFSPFGFIGAPPDGGLQPIAASARTGDGGPAPAAGPCSHGGTPNDPIPVECLPQVPPDPKADCPAIAQQIAYAVIIRSVYADPKLVAQANAAGMSGGEYEGLVTAALDAKFAGSGDVGANDGGTPSTPTSVQAGGATDPTTCEIEIYDDPASVPAAFWYAEILHESVHRKTCLGKTDAQKAAPITPAAWSADEVAAYTAEIDYLRRWYAAHCS